MIIDTGRAKLTSPDWSFIKKPEYKCYQIVENPGVIKHLIKKRWGIFYTAPDWNQLSISFDRVLIDLCASGPEIRFFSGIKANCVELEVRHETRALKEAKWAYFKNCTKLELKLVKLNDKSFKGNDDVLKSVQHPNAHMLLEEPIKVTDAFPSDSDEWYCRNYWQKVDVDNFVKCVEVSSIKTLTYTFVDKYVLGSGLSDKGGTAVFNCDEQFSSRFMAFLSTQRIYFGNFSNLFVTLESAKKSFLQNYYYVDMDFY